MILAVPMTCCICWELPLIPFFPIPRFLHAVHIIKLNYLIFRKIQVNLTLKLDLNWLLGIRKRCVGATLLSNTAFFDTELAMERTSSWVLTAIATKLRIIRLIKSSGCLWVHVYKKQASISGSVFTDMLGLYSVLQQSNSWVTDGRMQLLGTF